MRKSLIYLSLMVALLTSCSSPQLPRYYTESDAWPKVYPDYIDVTIPPNIAPLNMRLMMEADRTITRFSTPGYELVCDGTKIQLEMDDWRELTRRARDHMISVEVYAEKDEKWIHYRPFSIYVSTDSIDPWLTYCFTTLSQEPVEERDFHLRSLESFEDYTLEGESPSDSFLLEGTPRTELSFSKTDYPVWHPWMKLMAYTDCQTARAFHSANSNSLEILTMASDLMLYDGERHVQRGIESFSDELEMDPCWAPDGRSLYFCSASFDYVADSIDYNEMMLRYDQLKYNIYRKSFDPETRQFGPRQLVFKADSMVLPSAKKVVSMSATQPRISPNGQWMMFTLGKWGSFHIWHRDADLWFMDLKTGETRPMKELNSEEAEDDHVWSSNGCWVIFISRRNDGTFAQPFIAHIAKDGQEDKPFELPMEDPDSHRQLLKNYGLPRYRLR